MPDVPKQSDTQSRRKVLQTTGGMLAAGISGLAGCSGGSGSGDSVTLNFNIPTNEDSIQGKTPQFFKENVEKRTDSVDIELFFNGELGGQIESFESLSNGSLDMFITAFSLAGTQYKPIQVFDAPYLYKDYDHLLRITDPEQSDVANRLMNNMVEEAGIRVIGSVIQGTRRLTLSGEPAYSPQDLQGRKVRAVPTDILFESVNGLGAEAVNIEFSELPTSLSTGSVAGQENPYNIIWNSGIWENQDYLMETNHIDMPLPLFISEQTWESLTGDQQQVFRDAMAETKPKAREELESATDDYKEKMSEELEVIESSELEMEKFKQNARSRIATEFPEWMDDIEQIHEGQYA